MTQPGPESVGTPPPSAPTAQFPTETPTAMAPMMLAEAPAPRRGRGATIVLAILTVLLLLSTGAMTTMFLMKSKDADKLSNQLKARDTTITQNDDQIKSLKKQVEDSKQSTTAAEQKLKVYQDCVTALREAALAQVGGTADPAKVQKANEACIPVFLTS